MRAEIELDGVIFESAGQAVHVAFLILAQDAQQDAPLRKMLIRMMESINLTGNRQRAWLDQLRGAPSDSIDFSGLDGNDVRAQCAMIIHAVKTRLTDPEKWVLQAKFGETDYEDEAGQRRFAFSIERIEAIKGLSDWLAPSFPTMAPLAIDCMLGKFYANHKRIEISFRDLAASFGANHMTYARAYKRMRTRLRDLEEHAMERLGTYFRTNGVIA